MVGAVIVAVFMFGSIAMIFLVSERRFAGAGYDRRRRPPTITPTHLFDPAASSTLRGGARIRWSNATWPLATLTADSEWVRIKSPIGTVWIDRLETTSVQAVRGLMGPGVLFHSHAGIYDGVIFWTFSMESTRETLRAFGWPVTD